MFLRENKKIFSMKLFSDIFKKKYELHKYQVCACFVFLSCLGMHILHVYVSFRDLHGS